MKINLGGRPTKYDPKFCDELVKYFNIEPNYLKEIPHISKGGEWTDYKKIANSLPTFLGFANKIGVDTRTLWRWATEKYPEDYPEVEKRGQVRNKEFRHAYTRAKEMQKWFFIENALNGLYNPAFAIFLGKNIFNMKDKTETDITSQNQPMQVVGFNVLPPGESQSSEFLNTIKK